jgi:hypothetical protein
VYQNVTEVTGVDHVFSAVAVIQMVLLGAWFTAQIAGPVLNLASFNEGVYVVAGCFLSKLFWPELHRITTKPCIALPLVVIKARLAPWRVFPGRPLPAPRAEVGISGVRTPYEFRSPICKVCFVFALSAPRMAIAMWPLFAPGAQFSLR